MKKTITLCCLAFVGSLTLQAQNSLNLDSCRTLALQNNKTLSISKAKHEKSYYERKAAGTNFLPKISIMGGYMRTSEEISILSDDQKHALSNMGTTSANKFGEMAGAILQKHPELFPLIQAMGGIAPQIGGALNSVGQGIVDAFHTDTRNAAMGSILFTQPLYIGGKIRAYNRITRYAENISSQQLKVDQQQTILNVDQAYWQVVSLANKQKLARQYRDMLQQIDEDVIKMINEGMATKANELSVNVKLNEAEMTLCKVEDGLALSRMLLCQICGLPLDQPIILTDENIESLPAITQTVAADTTMAFNNRPEIQQLEEAAKIYQEKVKIARSAYLPQIALAGGFTTTYPGLTNGFEKKFKGMWNIGVTLSMPVWNWGESKYKIRSAKAEAKVAELQQADVREKITLQLHQAAFRVNEANKRLNMANKNLDKANENLRIAKVGFAEGVITTSDLLAAQTAWMQANSETIDAQIDTRLSHLIFAKAQGTLTTPTLE